MPRAVSALLAATAAAVMCQCGAGEGEPAPERLAQFDAVRIYHPQREPRVLVLLISGDGGWGTGIASIARDLAGRQTLVAGIDGRDFLHSLSASRTGCASPGDELAQLGRLLLERYHLPPQPPPVLVGHSAGATLAYVALVQAPAGTFSGALTLSFCTGLDLQKTLCPAPALQGEVVPNGTLLKPGGALPAPWVAVHGLDDRVCPASAGAAFAGAVPGASFLGIPGVGHDYRDRARWWPAFMSGYRRLAGTPQDTALSSP